MFYITLKDSPAVKSGTVGGIDFGRERLSYEYLRALHDWVEQCTTTHERCCRIISDTTQSFRVDTVKLPTGCFNMDTGSGSILDTTQCLQVDAARLPTRCIEVYPDSGSFLRYTGGLTGSYITLSHRWTQFSTACRTTGANYEERIKGQDLENRMSLHFQDACKLARGLGVKYVWIDSICIIQDTEDVTRELPKMSQYYQLSYFTVSAVNSNHEVDEGFLAWRGPSPIKSTIQMPYLQDGVQKGSISIYHREMTADAQFRRDVDQSELLTRGWVLQEWLLSRRIAYFGAGETFVECATQGVATFSFDKMKRQDMLPFTNMPDKVWIREGARVFAEAVKNQKVQTYGHKADHEEEWARWPLESWFSIASKYSATSLTVPDDRFHAISALASEFSILIKQKYGSEQRADLPGYLSGIWQQDICRGLMWISLNSASSVKECDGLAPTWSWLSLDTQVLFLTRIWHARNKQDRNREDFRPQKAIGIVGVDSLTEANVPEVLTPVIQMKLRAKLQYLVISGRVLDLTRMGHLTGTRFIDPALKEEDFFSVSSLDKPTSSGGWGKFERIEPLAPPACRLESATPLIALLVATREWGGMDYERPVFFSKGSPLDTYEVLFIQPVNVKDDIYKRVGAGIIFDPDIQRAFNDTISTEIILV